MFVKNRPQGDWPGASQAWHLCLANLQNNIISKQIQRQVGISSLADYLAQLSLQTRYSSYCVSSMELMPYAQYFADDHKILNIYRISTEMTNIV